MKLGGCQVIIKCDDRTMREVGTAVTGCGKAVSCYIASQPGKVRAEVWLVDAPQQT